MGGFFVLYNCSSRGVPEHDLSATAYWGTVGLLGFMFLGMAFPATIFVILIMSALVVTGLSGRRFSFLWPLGLLLWGVYWVALAYEVCAPSD